MAADSSIPGYAPDFTVLQSAAVALHEMFTSLTAAGFTEDQALSLVASSMNRERS